MKKRAVIAVYKKQIYLPMKKKKEVGRLTVSLQQLKQQIKKLMHGIKKMMLIFFQPKNKKKLINTVRKTLKSCMKNKIRLF